MNVLLLPGMSSRHHDWVRQVADALRADFDAVAYLDYRHWSDTDAQMDIGHEITRTATLADTLNGSGGYIVVAKSIGAAVTALAIGHGLLHPHACLFMGFPLGSLQQNGINLHTTLPRLPRTVFLHNSHDPLGTAEMVQQYVAELPPPDYRFVVNPGDTHDYIDFNQIRELANSLCV